MQFAAGEPTVAAAVARHRLVEPGDDRLHARNHLRIGAPAAKACQHIQQAAPGGLLLHTGEQPATPALGVGIQLGEDRQQRRRGVRSLRQAAQAGENLRLGAALAAILNAATGGLERPTPIRDAISGESVRS